MEPIRLPFPLRRYDDAEDRARFADRVARVDRPAGGIGDVRGIVEQAREPVVRLCDRVAHTGAAGDIDRLVVDEHPHQRAGPGLSVRWNRSSTGASAGAGSTPK